MSGVKDPENAGVVAGIEDLVQHFINEERERCAKVAESSYEGTTIRGFHPNKEVADWIAAAIRKRGEEP